MGIRSVIGSGLVLIALTVVPATESIFRKVDATITSVPQVRECEMINDNKRYRECSLQDIDRDKGIMVYECKHFNYNICGGRTYEQLPFTVVGRIPSIML